MSRVDVVQVCFAEGTVNSDLVDVQPRHIAPDFRAREEREELLNVVLLAYEGLAQQDEGRHGVALFVATFRVDGVVGVEDLLQELLRGAGEASCSRVARQEAYKRELDAR